MRLFIIALVFKPLDAPVDPPELLWKFAMVPFRTLTLKFPPSDYYCCLCITSVLFGPFTHPLEIFYGLAVLSLYAGCFTATLEKKPFAIVF